MQGIWSLIGKIGTGAAQNFPYEVGDKVGNLEDKSVWALHEGKKKVSCGLDDRKLFNRRMSINLQYLVDCF